MHAASPLYMYITIMSPEYSPTVQIVIDPVAWPCILDKLVRDNLSLLTALIKYLNVYIYIIFMYVQ